MSTQGNMGEVNEFPETLNEYSKSNWNNIPSSSLNSCTSGHYPTSDPVKAPGSDGSEFNITFSIQTTNPPSNSGCITKTLKPGENLSHKLTFPSNDNGGQSSKPLPKERKRKYNREGPALSDEEEEAKRQKAISSALWREKNIGIRKENIFQENTTVEINIEPSLSTSDPVKAPGSDGSEFNITFSVQTTNPPSYSGRITKTQKPGENFSHKLTFPSNDNGGQSSKPLPKERKRKYNREGPALSDEEEEAKRQKAKRSALWREKNIGIRKENIVQENTTVEIIIEPSLFTSDPVQRSEGVQMVLEERKKKILLLEGFKTEIGKQYYVEQHQPEQENRHFEKEMTWEKIEQGLELQIELENPKEKEGLTHKLEQSELENQKVKEGLTHKLEQSELENQKVKEGLTHKLEQSELENKKLNEEKEGLTHKLERSELEIKKFKEEREGLTHKLEQSELEIKKLKEKEGLTHKLEQSELENKKLKKEKEGLTHKLEQSELEKKKLKEEKKDLMKKRLECYASSFKLEHLLQTYYMQE